MLSLSSYVVSVELVCEAGQTAQNVTKLVSNGTINTNTTILQCVPCPAGSYGTTAGSTSATCDGNCTMGYYCIAGSTSPTQFICPAGTYGGRPGLTNATCSGLCAAGYWCAAGSTTPTYKECPVGSNSSAGATVQTQCQCIPGYKGLDGASCTACSEGQYKSVSGDSPCERCPSGRYGDDTGLTSSNCSGLCAAGYWCDVASISATSTACPAHSTSLAGADSSIDCLCEPGYSSDVNGGECFACGMSYFKPNNGTGRCIQCETGTYTADVGSAVCEEYPDEVISESLWASHVALKVLGPLFLFLAFGGVVAVHFFRKRDDIQALMVAPKGRPKSHDSYSLAKTAQTAAHITVPIAATIDEHGGPHKKKKKKHQSHIYGEEPKKSHREQVQEMLRKGDEDDLKLKAKAAAKPVAATIAAAPVAAAVRGVVRAKKSAAKKAVAKPPAGTTTTSSSGEAAASTPVLSSVAPVTAVVAPASASASSTISTSSPLSSVVVAEAVTPRADHQTSNDVDASVEPFDLSANNGAASTSVVDVDGSDIGGASAPTSSTPQPPAQTDDFLM